VRKIGYLEIMSDTEDRDQETVPEGMVRKTRRVRKKRRSKPSSGEEGRNADTLFSKAKDLLVGMEEDEGEYGHVNVSEQVRRLKEKKEGDGQLDEVWGTKRRSSSWLWIVLTGLIFGVVALVIGFTFFAKEEPRIDDGLGDKVSRIGQLRKVDIGSGPLGWFHGNSVQVLDDAKTIIDLVNTAESSENFSEFVRESPNVVVEELDVSLWGKDRLTNPTSNFIWLPQVVGSSEDGDGLGRGFLRLMGTRVDGNPYEAYFVEEDNRVTLDWEATTGWSEMSVSEIARKEPRKEIFLRCRVTKKSSFDQMMGRFACSGYVISGEIPDQFFLAYVPVATKDANIALAKATDNSLKQMLNYGSFVSSEPPFENQKATLRVRYNDELGSEGAFEIVEFLYKDWVSP